ncbi:MAG: hypothetical protein LBC43_03925 [Bifidobacteriaceae bacterium]|jgi:16S rRNA processing protein RimM|nr:hypothetical protein [Bifidobacteriaceae bacterium]
MEKEVARIVGVRGLQGQVKIQVLTDQPQERFKSGTCYGNLEITSYQSFRGKHFLTFRDHSTVESVRPLIGQVLSVEIMDNHGVRNNESASETDKLTRVMNQESNVLEKAIARDNVSYYPEQLVDLAVKNSDNEILGIVTGVNFGAAQDQLVIQLASYSNSAGERLIPFVDELVPELNLNEGWIRINPIEGLL